MVYYRKYRPQKIADLDSIKLKETLYGVLSGKSVPHAFLFTGPKGLGKTSTARIVAKAVNCEHKSQKAEGKKNKDQDQDFIEPDNTCEQCISITNGTNIDILEIDGASNRGIDEIRELREKVNLSPSLAKKKVYIIDEVHMLTTEAFNALLKTIEEPPSHVMFIFCTTEPHKIPATIMSRCFHIAFHLATEDEIVHSLKRIVNGEKIDVSEDTLYEIAKISEGGFRDAAKILEELVVLSKGEKITKDFFEKTYKTASILSHVSKLLAAFKNENKQEGMKQGLKIVDAMVSEGVDINFFIYQVLSALNENLLEKIGVTKEKEDKYPIGLQFEIEEIKVLVDLLSKAYQDTKFAVIKQLPLEMVIIEYCSYLKKEIAQDQSNAFLSRTAENNSKNTVASLLRKQQIQKVKSMLGKKAEEKPNTKTTEEKVHQSNINSRPDDLTSLFENIIYKVKPYNHSVAGVLRGSKIREVNEKEIVFEAAYKFHKERLEDKKTCEIIEKVVKEVTGKNLKVSVKLKK